jgi:hypothetical protein
MDTFYDAKIHIILLSATKGCIEISKNILKILFQIILNYLKHSHIYSQTFRKRLQGIPLIAVDLL